MEKEAKVALERLINVYKEQPRYLSRSEIAGSIYDDDVRINEFVTEVNQERQRAYEAALDEAAQKFCSAFQEEWL